MEEVIDRGALFKYTQDYNLNAIVSSNFRWSNSLPDAFFDVKDTITYPPRHYDQISVSKSLSYENILEIVVKYTPKTLFIAKPIRDDDDVPELNIDFMKLKNLTCFIYYFDLKINFITKYFPNIKHLFVDSVSFSKTMPENFKQATLNNLEVLCVNVVGRHALNITAPGLLELSLYCWEGNRLSTKSKKNTKMADDTKNANERDPQNMQPVLQIPNINLDNYQMLRILRLDDSIQIKTSNRSKLLRSLQFFYHQNITPSYKNGHHMMTRNKTEATNALNSDNVLLKEIKGNFDPQYYLSILESIKPSEVIIPPNIFTPDIIKTLRSSYNIQRVGIYTSENYCTKYFENFPNSLEIYDYNNLHACMAIRYSDDLTKYISRTYSSVVPDLDDLILGMHLNNNDDNNVVKDSMTSALSPSENNQNSIVCLTNFDISDPSYNYKWMYIFHNIESEFRTKPIIITRCEIVKPDKEFTWPSIAWAMKKRVIVMNLQKQTLHLDISNTSTNALINLLDNINGSFPFVILIIVTHGFTLTSTNIMQIKAHFENVNITVQDVPYILYS